MNVHIICRDLNEDKILPRLAKTLAERTGWTLSESPDPKADLNYWMIYITYAESNSDFKATPTAAYFSHYEPDSPFKAHWWGDASNAVDGCILTARKYDIMLPSHTPKFFVRPPVDANLFTLRIDPSRIENIKPRIGVSGFVDKRSFRKNDSLIKLLAEKYSDRYEIVGCGVGWSVPTKYYEYKDLPAFYHSLDLLLCPSSIEGIPMPPLEVLACGVPIVIPNSVGLLDDLPVMAGITRYTSGNFRMMVEAIEKSLITDYDPRALRKVITDIYTPSHWCADHENAFAELLKSKSRSKTITAKEKRERESDRHGSRGVYYVAFGNNARNCAVSAMKSFRQFMPVPIALASDKPLGGEDIFIESRDEDIGGRSVKTKIYDLTPPDWQYVLYLDADTEVIAPVGFLYELLEDGFDMVICKNPGKYHTARQMVRSDNKNECDETFNRIGTDELIQLNGGVFSFQRNERTATFFRAWHEEWIRYGKRDQAALLRSLFAHPLKLCVLGSEWNTITRYDSRERAAAILHYPMTARRWRGVINHPLNSPEAWKEVDKFESQGSK